MQVAIWIVVPTLLIAIFGRGSARAADVDGLAVKPGEKLAGQPGGTDRAGGALVTGASWAKVGSEYFDVRTGSKLTRSEVEARAKAEGFPVN